MALTRLKLAAALLLLVGPAAGAGALARQETPGKPVPAGPGVTPRAAAAEGRRPRSDTGDKRQAYRAGAAPPPGAGARMGSPRLRHGGVVNGLAFAPDGKTLLSLGQDGQLRVWDTATGREVRRVPVAVPWLPLVSFSADGKSVAVDDFAGKLRVLDVATGKEKAVQQEDKGLAEIALSPDAKVLLSANEDGFICCCDTGRAEECKWDLESPPGRHPGLAVAPDGRRFAAGWKDNTVLLAETASGKAVRTFPFPRATGPWSHRVLAFSPDGRFLAASDGAASVSAWDVETGERVLRRPGRPGFPPDVPVALAFAPDGRFLAAGCADRKVRVWRVGTSTEVRRFEAHTGAVRGVAFSPDGKTIATCGQDHAVRLWDAGTGREMHPAAGHRGAVLALRFSADGRRFVSAGTDGAVHLWDVQTGKHLEQVADHTGPVTCLATAPDAGTVFSMAYEGGVHVWRAGKGKEVRWTGLSFGGTVPMLFTPDGKTLVYAMGGPIRLRETKPGKPERVLPGKSPALALAVAPDGRRLAVAGRDRTLHVWDLASGRELGAPGVAGAADVTGVMAFAPDGRTLAAWDGELHLWEVFTGAERIRLPKSPGPVTALAFSDDGRLLALAHDGSAGGTLRVLDPSTGQELGQAESGQGTVRALAFSRDGRWLASGGADTTVLRFDGAALARVKPPAGALTAAELAARWEELGGADAARAHRALGSLAGAPGQSLPFLKEKLRPAQGPAPRRIARLITELDSDDFETRERASRDLAEQGPAVVDSLRRALANDPSAEARKRLTELLARIKTEGVAPRWRRAVRALEVLEKVGTAEAREVLGEVARRAPDTDPGREAQAALERLAQSR